MSLVGMQTKNGTYYWEYGRKTGEVIVMIHGFRGTHHGLEFIAEHLPEYRIIIPDLPGFGATRPMKNSHSIADYSDWLNDFLSDLKLQEKPILLGHSFGSIVVAGFVEKYPDKIKKLVLVNPIAVPAKSRPALSMTKIGMLYAKLGFMLPEKLSKIWHSAKLPTIIMTICNARTRDRNLRKLIHEQHLKYFSTFSDTKTLYMTTNTSINNSVLQFAKNIVTDTLLIIGEKDIISSVREQHELRAKFKKATLKSIKNVGHLTHYETPDQVAELVREFTKPL